MVCEFSYRASDCAGSPLAGRANDADCGRKARPGTAVPVVSDVTAVAGENAQTLLVRKAMSIPVERAAIAGADVIPTPLEPEEFQRVAEAVQREVASAIVGQEEAIQGVLITLIAGGHALLEGVPGLGKTSLVRAFARALDLRYGRIQFTPDLMPADVTGTTIIMEDETGRRAHTFQK